MNHGFMYTSGCCRYGDPLTIFHEWHGIPERIDSYVQIIYIHRTGAGPTNLDIETLFFKGQCRVSRVVGVK